MLAPQVRPYAYLAVAVLGYSLEPIALKSLVGTMPLLRITFWLCFFSTSAMGAVILLDRREKFLLVYTKNDLLKIIAMGFVGMVLFNILISYGFTYLPVGEANSLKYTWPVLLAVLAVPVMRERLTKEKLAGVLLGLAGVWLLMNGGITVSLGSVRLDAVAAVLAAAFCWALFNISQKKFGFEAFTSLFLMGAFSLVAIAPFVLPSLQSELPSLSQFAALAYLGVISFGVSLAFYFKALQCGDTARIAALSYVAPFLSLGWAALLVGETIYWYYPVALSLVVAAAFVQLRAPASKQGNCTRETVGLPPGFYDLTPLFSGTRSPELFRSMKGGGSVLAVRYASQNPLSRLESVAGVKTTPLVFTDKAPPEGVESGEMLLARGAVGAGTEETVVFSAGEMPAASAALRTIAKNNNISL